MNAHEHEMTEHEIKLRNALHSAAESIEPHSDGLLQIKTRLGRRTYPLPVAWAAATWMRLTMWLPEGAYTAGGQLAGKLRPVYQLFLPKSGSADRDGNSPWSLLRPLTAFAIAVFVVAVGAYVAIEVPAVVSPSGQSTQRGSGHGGSGSGGGGLTDRSSSPIGSTRSGQSAMPTGSA